MHETHSRLNAEKKETITSQIVIVLRKRDEVEKKRDKKLKEQGVFLKMVSNQHKSLNQVEACSAIIKETLYTLNKNIASPLSIFDWQYAMRICEKAVFTGPLAATKKGKDFYTSIFIEFTIATGLHWRGDFCTQSQSQI